MRKILNSELHRVSNEEFKSIPKTPILLIADNIRSLNNIGSLFRTADAFAIEKIYLCGITATPPNREIHKTALGAELTVEWDYFSESVAAAQKAIADGYVLTAVEQVEGAVMLNDFVVDPNTKYAIVMGNEVDGVSQEVVDLCQMAIEIPQIGTKHSLNVSVAAGVVRWALFKQYRKDEI
ncbi:MAG: TrmH family RNA methyltransferase [Rikenellaceae bacterium]